MNRFIRITQNIQFSRTTRPRIGPRSSAHAQSPSTIAVWLARLVARVWPYCQEIRSFLICGQVKSVCAYFCRPNCASNFNSSLNPEEEFISCHSFCWGVRVYRGIVCGHTPVYINFHTEWKSRSVFSYFHAHFNTSFQFLGFLENGRNYIRDGRKCNGRGEYSFPLFFCLISPYKV